MSKFIVFAILPLILASPPGISSISTSKSQLADLTVGSGSADGYDRDLFPHWITRDGCTTRETILKRDGTNVQTDDSCKATSGKWTSPYDGETWTKSSDVDIDHVVPLANAWKSGASEWTTDERETLANDLDHPQLLVVTDNVNEQKGDSGPEEWKPSLTDYHCTYARMWVTVKSVYNLTVTSDEKSALQDMLDSC